MERTELDKPEEANTGISFAEQEFRNYCDANEIDYNEDAMDEDDRKDFIKIKRRFMSAVNEKRIIIDGTKLMYTVSDFSPKEMAGTKITVSRPNGRSVIAMDGYKDTQQVQKLQAFITAICGFEKRDIAKIAALDKKDYRILQDIAMLFLID